ncbi:MAG TPA: Phenylacetic acid catabolic protein [Ktedonobacterales bacterium]
MTDKTYSPATKQALFSLIARLADNKHYLGRNYAEWCSGAPTLESAVAAAAMAQDELGHARALYPLLKTLAPQAEASELDPDTRTEFLRLSLLERPFTSWFDFVAANFLTDNALTVIFESGVDSSYEPLAGRSRKVLQEESLHSTHGEAWVRQLARDGGAVRDALQAALQANWDETLMWFGASDGEDPLAADGVLDATPDTLRARFLAKVGPRIVAEKLDLPTHATAGAKKTFELTEELPWERWDAVAYRLKPAARVAKKAAAR